MTKLTADQLKEIKAAMLKKNFKYRQSNGIDNYLHAAILQGIEMKGNNINPFVVGDNGERVYGYDHVGNETRAAVSIIEQILMDVDNDNPVAVANKHEVPKQEIETKEAEIVPKVDNQLYGIIPDNLTNALIDNHPGTIPCLIGLQKTPEQYLCERKGPGNKMITYVEGHVMKREANFAFLFNWDSEVLEVSEYDFEFTALVQCTFRFTEGHTVVKVEEGGADKKFSKTQKDKEGNSRLIMIADTKKAAITDAIKCCLRDMGFNNDVFSGVRKCQKSKK
jgi:hypothetical protein